jgi:hypothetical protein
MLLLNFAKKELFLTTQKKEKEKKIVERDKREKRN